MSCIGMIRQAVFPENPESVQSIGMENGDALPRENTSSHCL